MSNETEVALNRLQEHEAIMRLADDYADDSRRLQVGIPSLKRSELYNALWKALKL